ncbi:APC family permease [Legionella sp. W05-934-2]|jgi:amino acid transporter|uniref:APC family permease n=1 Tax=Legionella sp. W05-934-2 TaxID=1198649 RepID=UPI0034627FBF
MIQRIPVEKISIVALVLLITGAIDSIRNLPATALFGSTLIFFFILSAIIFLIPVALVAAELSSAWPEDEGGIYSWVRHAFGSGPAFFAIWLQWVNTVVWYPTIISFIAGTLAYLINPVLATNKLYIISVILIVFWSLTFIGIAGIRTSANIAGICAFVGMIIPMAFIILLAIIWLIKGNPIAVDLSWHKLLPVWHDSQSWVSLTAIMTAFLGMELAAVHVKNIDNPQHNFPRAMMYSATLILFTMILGSLAIAFVLPSAKISLVDGVMQAFDNFFRAYHLRFLLPITAILLLIGSVGGMINWVISPAKGLMMAAEHGFLPHWMAYRNKHGVPSRILLLQAVLVTLFCSTFLLLPSINSIYWLFTDLSTEMYIVMYVFMFFAAIKQKEQFAHRPRVFQIPFGNIGYYGICVLGLVGCTITLIVGFIPPKEAVQLGDQHWFQVIFSCGIILMLLPAVLIYWHKKRAMKRDYR